MSFEPSSAPISGGIFLVGVAYVASAMLLTGPTVGQRVIEKSNFVPRCEQAIVMNIQSDTPEFEIVPTLPDCNSVMGLFLGAESSEMCDLLKPFMRNPVARQIEAQNRRLTDAHNQRINEAATRANSTCTCAVFVQLQDRVPWALYAGSFRIHVPSEIRNLDAELFAALNSPVCAGEFQ